MVVVINPIVADCSADAADVADVVDVGDSLKVETVTNGAALLGAGRVSAGHAVELLAHSAEGPAELLLPALPAGCLSHLLKRPNEELQLMAVEAFVVLLKPLEPSLLRGDELANLVVPPELLKGGDGQLAEGGVVGAVKLHLDVGHSSHQEGRAAPVWATVQDLTSIRHAFHAEDPSAGGFALDWFDADLIANSTLVGVPGGAGLEEGLGSGWLALHHLTGSPSI